MACRNPRLKWAGRNKGAKGVAIWGAAESLDAGPVSSRFPGAGSPALFCCDLRALPRSSRAWSLPKLTVWDHPHGCPAALRPAWSHAGRLHSATCQACCSCCLGLRVPAHTSMGGPARRRATLQPKPLVLGRRGDLGLPVLSRGFDVQLGAGWLDVTHQLDRVSRHPGCSSFPEALHFATLAPRGPPASQ